MAETPKEIEIKVIYGSQLRAIVRSALLHVRNKVAETSSIEDESQARVLYLIDGELSRWPIHYPANGEDELPRWLYDRLADKLEAVSTLERTGWDQISDEDKGYWAHEAAAVRRAVGRMIAPANRTPEPFKVTDAGMVVLERHDALVTHLRKLKEAGDPVVSIQQVLSLLGGHTQPVEYTMGLQHTPDQKPASVSNPRPNDDGSFTIYASNAKLDGRPIPDQEIEFTPRPPYDVSKARCWCGGEVGPREPGDSWGNGCKQNITHKWDGVETGA